MKIGIVSTSRIIDVFWEALPEMQDITVSAICCRPQSVSKARAWSEMHQIPAVYTDYDKFLAEGDYDIIYDGTVNSMHYPDALRAVQAGRSIIMEKPFTLTAKECADVIRLAQDRNVWLFEAITTLHSPCFQFMKECLPRLGPLRGGTMSFSMMPPRYAPYRQRIALSTTFDPKLGGGCLMDMNVYNLHLAIGLLGAPDCAAYYPNRGWNGIDTSGLAVLQYPEFTMACYAAKDSAGPCGMFLQGEYGYLQLLTPPNTCGKAIAVIRGETRTFENPPLHRFAIEFNSIRNIWETRNRAAHDALLRQSQAVMDTIAPLYETVLKHCT